MKPARLLLVSALFLSACASTQKPSVIYTSIGEARIAADSAVVQRYLADYEKRHPTSRVDYVRERERRANSPNYAREVRVLIDAFPEGIEVRDGTLSVQQESPHHLLGRVSLSSPSVLSPLHRQEIVEELQHLAHEAGGNVVMMSFIGGDQERALGAFGYILKSDLSKLDPQKNQSGKIPTQI